MPQELFCFLHESQRLLALNLTAIVADTVIQQKRGLEYDGVLKNDYPIIKDTQIQGVFGYPNPAFGTEFDLVRDESDRPRLQIITLIPVTLSEAEFIGALGADELWEIFRQKSQLPGRHPPPGRLTSPIAIPPAGAAEISTWQASARLAIRGCARGECCRWRYHCRRR